jgi:hypothetical protein
MNLNIGEYEANRDKLTDQWEAIFLAVIESHEKQQQHQRVVRALTRVSLVAALAAFFYSVYMVVFPS